MNNFAFYSPTYFAFGKGEENNTGKYVKRFGGSKVLIQYGGGSVVRSGLVDRIKASLEAEGLSYVLLGGVKPNPRSGLVYEAVELCKKENVDFILAVGGGSVIDSSKATAAGAMYDGDFWDFFEGKAIEAALPVGVVLTIAASGSEGSPDCIITREKDLLKRGAGGDILRPRFSVLNPELTMTLPAYQTACGVTDIMSHLMERYFTNTKNVETTDRLIEGLLQAMIHQGRAAMKDPSDYESRANIMWTGTLAHNDCCGVGRDQDWACHRIEHELSALYDCAHGAGLAVVIPAWMKHVYSHDVMRFAQFAVRVFGCSMDFESPEITALEGIEAFKAFVKDLGMPSTFAELGAKEEDIERMADSVKACGNFVKLGKPEIMDIYRAMM